jgi:hypothetical protein
MAAHHLAQLNVARARTPLDAPEMDEFTALLEPVNALADRSPGFVWRLQDEGGDATSIRAFDDDRIIVNMSVWDSMDALWSFVYDSGHLDVMRRRREWFQRFETAYLVLWWVPAGHVPTVEEALARLDLLEANGPTPDAFTFKVRFEPSAAASIVDERTGCPA